MLKDFYIDGNRPGAAAGTDVTGIGVRLYCRMPSIHNLRVVNCAAHGVETALAAGNLERGILIQVQQPQGGAAFVLLQSPGRR